MTYRYKAKNGRIREGRVEDLKSSAFYRVVAALKVGERNTKSLRSAGIEWIERKS
jgi:hypothetical protein